MQNSLFFFQELHRTFQFHRILHCLSCGLHFQCWWSRVFHPKCKYIHIFEASLSLLECCYVRCDTGLFVLNKFVCVTETSQYIMGSKQTHLGITKTSLKLCKIFITKCKYCLQFSASQYSNSYPKLQPARSYIKNFFNQWLCWILTASSSTTHAARILGPALGRKILIFRVR